MIMRRFWFQIRQRTLVAEVHVAGQFLLVEHTLKKTDILSRNYANNNNNNNNNNM
jgi:hypothetical protein